MLNIFFFVAWFAATFSQMIRVLTGCIILFVGICSVVVLIMKPQELRDKTLQGIRRRESKFCWSVRMLQQFEGFREEGHERRVPGGRRAWNEGSGMYNQLITCVQVVSGQLWF